MTDIVERLRHYAIAWEKAGVSGEQETATRAVREAADEIERLRRERIAMDEAMRQEMHHGSIRDERHDRIDDAITKRASGDHPAVA